MDNHTPHTPHAPTTAGAADAYEVPSVLDGGPVTAVTLGKNGFDRVDGSQYRDKTPGVTAL